MKTNDIDKETFVIYINSMIGGSYNEYGIKNWWNRPRFKLDGRTPLEVLESEDFESLAYIIEDLAKSLA